MSYEFRKATASEIPEIWEILQQAILRRKAEGSNQWQDGYPNIEVIHKDLNKGAGFVLTERGTIVGYTAVLINDEPEYRNITGKWLSSGDFVVIHRVAISDKYLGRRLAGKILDFVEAFARSRNIYSIKADTNFDNSAMLRTFEKKGFVYCGEVYFRGSARRAYEKLLDVSA